MLYLFQLGHQPQISTAELLAVFSQKNLPYKEILNNKEYLILETEKKLNTTELINQLGGTIKIGEEITTSLFDYLNSKYGKIIFSINDKQKGIEMKMELKNSGRSVRYIEPKNTATILHNNLLKRETDITVINKKYFFTSAIQPFEEMGHRDFDRPGSDDKSGMLPPKLAKIMVNLSLQDKTKTILDPFCGSGTVLTEAMVMGYTNLIGSDISPKAISDTEKNINWLSQQQFNNRTIEQSNNTKLFVSDATKLSTHLKPASVDCIVAEPYMGQPLRGNESQAVLKNQATELTKLYLESFKSFYKILKKDGIVVFIIPKWKLVVSKPNPYGDSWVEINIENQIKKIGFEIVQFAVETHNCASPIQTNVSPTETHNCASLQYHRPNQHLARTIWRYKKIPI